MDEITVIKLSLAGEETWRYSGRLLERFEQGMLIEARFNRDDVPFHGILLRRGDPFIEAYYSDRWYNIFQLHDCDSGEIKGWYCNVTRPAELSGDHIRYVDLALDLLVYPDGRQLALDEDEFQALPLDPATRAAALEALEELKRLVRPLDGFRLGAG